MADGKNYTIAEGDWQPLSDIMGDDYETTAKYGVHVDLIPGGNFLGWTVRPTTAPERSDRGREVPSFSVIEVDADTGDDVYFRGTNGPIVVEIYEIS